MRLFIVIAILLFAINGVCGELNDEFNYLANENDELTKLEKEIQSQKIELEKVEQDILKEMKELRQENEELNSDKESWAREAKMFRDEIGTFNATQVAEFNRWVANHNANRPDPKDKMAVEAWLREGREMEARRQELQRISDKFDMRKEQLSKSKTRIETFGKQVSNHSKNVELRKKDFNETKKMIGERERQLVQRRRNYNSRLEEYKRSFARCKELLNNPNTRDEALRWGCGNVNFDGGDPNLPILDIPKVN